MSGHVQPQIDIGSASLQGLAPFQSVLAALSADNVVPTAMLQMENLGSFFLTTGPLSERTPDLLQRCNSTRLERIGLVIGWRKGDSASLMAQSAGGQAAALLSAGLSTLYDSSHVGEILYGLSIRLLPAKRSISSVAQLAIVGELLNSKLAAIGFGNLLAQHFVKFDKIFKARHCHVPKPFVCQVSCESIIDLLCTVSQALKEEKNLVRVRGSYGMSQITWLVLTLFPQDTRVTVDGIITHEGLRKNILVDIRTLQDNFSVVTTHIETVVGSSIAPEIRIHLADSNVPKCSPGYTWDGWIADYLTNELSRAPVLCSDELLQACSNAVASIATGIKGRGEENRFCYEEISHSEGSERHNPKADASRHNSPSGDSISTWSDSLYIDDYNVSGDLNDFLGYPSYESIRKRCSSIFRVDPSAIQKTPYAALTHLEEAISGIKCSDGWHGCVPQISFGADSLVHICGWDYDFIEAVVHVALLLGLTSLFINAGPNVVMTGPHFVYGDVNHLENMGKDFFHLNMRLLSKKGTSAVRLRHLDGWIRSFLDDDPPTCFLAKAFSSSTMLPSAVRTLRIPKDHSVSYELYEGNLVFDGRYHSLLMPNNARYNSQAKWEHTAMQHKKRSPITQAIVPSNHGKHEDVVFTMLERAECIELRTEVRYAGQVIELDLSLCVDGSLLVREAEACGHHKDAPLDLKTYGDRVVETSVKSMLYELEPASLEEPGLFHLVGITQTKADHMAQFLSCQLCTKALLARKCCLTCATKQAFRSLDPQQPNVYPDIPRIIVT